MLRTLLTPRWLGFTALAVLAVLVCAIAARWQYQRTADQLELERAALAEEAEYEAVVADDLLPTAALGRAVTLTGTPVAAARSFVRSRVGAAGEEGYLVVDGLRTADGRVVAVLQGWVPDRAAAPSPSERSVALAGRVQPDENFYRDAPISAEDPLVTITRPGLLAQWGRGIPGIEADLAPGYVTATSPDVGFERVPPVFGAAPDVPFPLQNAFYSIQWLIFAGMVVFVWLRGLLLAARPAGWRAVQSEQVRTPVGPV